MPPKLSKAQTTSCSNLIATLPEHTDLLQEIKVSLTEAITKTRTEAITFLRIRLEPSVLVNDDIADKKTVYRAILEILQFLGLTYEPKPGISVVETTIDTLFDEENFAVANKRAKDLYEQHVNGRSSGQVISPSSPKRASYRATQDYRSTNNSNSPSVQDAKDSISRKLTSASYIFRDSSHRFSGTIDCTISLQRFRKMLIASCEQYAVPEHCRVSILTNALEGPALDHYLDYISGSNMSLAEAFSSLHQRFDSPHTRAQAQAQLDTLTLSQIRESEKCSTTRALEIAIKKISTIAPKCGQEYSHESHKGRWLAQMLKYEHWAHQCCVNRMTLAQDYKTFVSSLHSAITQLHLSQDPSPHALPPRHPPLALPQPSETFFGQHYAVARPRLARARPSFRSNYGRRSVAPRHKTRMNHEQLRQLKENTNCLRCGSRGHWRAECPRKDITMSEAVKARMRSMGTNYVNTQEILTALVRDEDEYAAYLTQSRDILPVEEAIQSLEITEPHDDWHTAELESSSFEAMMAQLDAPTLEPQPIQDTSGGPNPEGSNMVGCSQHFPTSIDDVDIVNIHFVLHTVETGLDLHNFRSFRGGIVDTGAQRTVIGQPQAEAYFHMLGHTPKKTRTNRRFRFGLQVVHALYSFAMVIPTPRSSITIHPDVVPGRIPLLIGLDVMRTQGLQPLIIQLELESVYEGWRLPLTLEGGHLYLRWFPTRRSCMHRQPKTGTLHTWFNYVETTDTHPTNHDFTAHRRQDSLNPQPCLPRTQAMRVSALLNPQEDPQPTSAVTLASPSQPAANKLDASQVTSPTRSDDITHNTSPRPGRKFTNTELLRIHRHFSHASARKLYELLRRSTASVPPNTLQQLETVVAACKTCLELAPRPVSFRVREADSTLFNQRLTLDLLWLPARIPASTKTTRPVLHVVDVGTRFNATTFVDNESTSAVWNAFLKSWCCMYVGTPSSLLVDQGSAFISDEWRYACQLSNIELVPTGTGSHNSLNVGETYHAYLRRIYNKIHHDFPNLPDDIVLAIATKAINDTTGPKGLCPTLLVFGVLPQLPTRSRRDHPGQLQRFRAAAAARREYELIVNDERLRIAARRPPPPATNRCFHPGDMVYVYREKHGRYTGPHMIASVHNKNARVHVGEPTGPRAFNITHLRPSPLPNARIDNITEPRYPPTVLYTEILRPGDAREEMFDDEKRKELLGLLERGAFRICLREEAGAKPNVVPTRYVLAIKHSQTKEPPRLKARFVIGGHRDRDRNLLIHDSRTVRAESVRLVLALATIFGLNLAVADWTQGYIQSKSELLRKIYVRPKELNLTADELVQVVRPVYGLSDSGDYWAETLTRHLRDHLKFKQATTDLSLWLQTVGTKLCALAACYVDDVLLAATPLAMERFRRISKQRFDVDFDTSKELGYLGLRILTTSDGTRHISQPKQINRLRLLSETCTFAEFRSARASLAWLQQTRPDVACAISMTAKVTQQSFSADAVKSHNATVRYLRRTRGRTLSFPKLDPDSLRMVCYIDAGQCSTEDGRSQLGILILLSDRHNLASILQFSSKRSKRVVRSTTSAEGLAFATGFDAAFASREDLHRAIGRLVPIIMITDSEILFNIITKRKLTTERRMMIDLRIIREAYIEREIANIALIASEHNPADALTKIKSNSALRDIMDSSSINHPIRQFVVEPDYCFRNARATNAERLRASAGARCVDAIDRPLRRSASDINTAGRNNDS